MFRSLLPFLRGYGGESPSGFTKAVDEGCLVVFGDPSFNWQSRVLPRFDPTHVPLMGQSSCMVSRRRSHFENAFHHCLIFTSARSHDPPRRPLHNVGIGLWNSGGSPPGRRSPLVTCCALSLEDRRGSRPRRPLSPSLCTPRAGTTQYRATFSLRIQESSSVRAQKMSLAAPPKTLRGARSCSSAIRIGPPWVPLPQVDFFTQCLCRGAVDTLSSREEA